MALAGWREDRGWLVRAGASLLGVTAAVNLYDLIALWWTWGSVSGGAAGRDGRLYTSVIVGTGAESGPDVFGALSTVVALAGPVLLAVGALRGAVSRAV
ncbi:hypothetical protein ABT297_17420 [Dactylosporangium sp. NPDC000555]|uniref:hypothetical protein n=1 Tax=Dactylosporangium sp. NPDC000555 TaxID=3154260 RepID=UPI00332BDDB7